MATLTPVDAAHVQVVDDDGWRTVEVPSGRVGARGAGSPPVAVAAAKPGTAVGQDAGGTSAASADRVSRDDLNGRTVCSVPLDGAKPRAVAASTAWLAFAGEAGVLLVDLGRCAPVAASPTPVDGLVFVGDTLWALEDGALRPFTVPGLDAPPARVGGILGPVDAVDHPRVATGEGLLDPTTGSFVALPAVTSWLPDRAVSLDAGHLRVTAADGTVLAEEPSSLVSLVEVAWRGGDVVATDGTRVQVVGHGTTRLTDPTAPLLPAAPASVRRDGTATVAWATPGWTVEAPWDVARVGGGVRLVDTRSGRPRGAVLPVPAARSAAADPEGRILATTVEGQTTAWDVATGRTLWTLRGEGAVAGFGRSSVGMAAGRGLVLHDPGTGAAAWTFAGDGAITMGTKSWRPGDPPLVWPGHPVAGAAPAEDAPLADPLAVLAAFGGASGWNALERTWDRAWCGRGDEAKGLLAPWPAVQARVATVLAACTAPAAPWVSVAPAKLTPAAAEDTDCTEPLPAQVHPEIPLPLQAGRPTLVLAGPGDRADTVLAEGLPAGLDVLVLGDAPEDWSTSGGRTVVHLTRARPLSTCLAPLASGTGGLLVDGTGHARLRGTLESLVRAAPPMVLGGGEAALPALRITADAPVRGLVAGSGAVVAWTDTRVGRIAPVDGGWTVPVHAVAVSVAGDLVLVDDGSGLTRAYALADGTFRWRYAGHAAGADGHDVLLVDASVTRAITPDGTVAWTHAAPGRRTDAGYTTRVGGWTCTRGPDRAPLACARVDAAAPADDDVAVADGEVILRAGHRVVAHVAGADHAVRIGGRTWVGGDDVAGGVYEGDGRLSLALPPLRTVVTEGGRLWGVRQDGTVEVYRP